MITFIIPTIGRSTLLRTLDSLYAQTDGRWRAIIIFDGVPSSRVFSGDSLDSLDRRVQVLEIEKSGVHINSAGLVRNAGIRSCLTEWVGFVDDDDTLSSRYVETFYSEVESYPKVEVLLFRMYVENPSYLNPDCFILPKLNTADFYWRKTGISFALRTSIFLDRGVWFEPSEEEDYLFLDGLRRRGFHIMISPYIRYFVRVTDDGVLDDFDGDLVVGNRVIIS
jgi:glycosyltransferase involved in cell wall biosynthesis